MYLAVYYIWFIFQENYGFSFLEVRDNGRGIKEEDVQYVAKPHFTSKIQTFADLGLYFSILLRVTKIEFWTYKVG